MRKRQLNAFLAVLAGSVPALASVPKATCRNANIDRPETGMQGETTKAEIDNGLNKLGFSCNVDVVGAVQGEGASWQLSAYKNCAYYDQANNLSQLKQPGAVAVDVSDPTHPRITAHLTEPSMIDPWESLKVNVARGLLAGDQMGGPGFAVYDIATDCTHPALKASVVLPGSRGHTGQWAPDGNTYYVTTIGANPSIVAVDTSDASNPKALLFWTAPTGTNPQFHDLELSKDGNTAYVSALGGLGRPGPYQGNGIIILDVSDIQKRLANPTIRVISYTTWNDGSRSAQNALPITIGGKPYLLTTDEGGQNLTGFVAAQQACTQGLLPNGPPRIFDISDPAAPKLVSTLTKETDDPANCPRILAMAQTTASGTQSFGTSCHYCNVDDPDHATMAACSCFTSGWRFYDIRDPAKPKEIGYYKPPAQGTKVLPASQYFLQAGTGFNRPVDWAPSKASFPKDRAMSSGDVWVTTMDNGFQVLHFDAGGGGCSSAGPAFGVLAAVGFFGVLRNARRRRSRG
jgi:hypothetical protein